MAPLVDSSKLGTEANNEKKARAQEDFENLGEKVHPVDFIERSLKPDGDQADHDACKGENQGELIVAPGVLPVDHGEDKEHDGKEKKIDFGGDEHPFH
jgi:hypothetical protein